MDDLPMFMRELRQREAIAARMVEFAILTGVLVAVLCGIVWATSDSFPRFIRRIAILALIGILLLYCLYVYSILSVSDCGLVDGRLRCMNRNF